MANRNDIDTLKQGVEAWNEWKIGYLDEDAGYKLADFSHADLSEMNLEGIHLEEVNLRGANLRGANLIEADLSVSDLSDAILKDAVLRKTVFEGATLFNTDLSGADLQGANLGGADLRGANLSHAKLRGADLSRANLKWSNLSGADFSEVVMYDTIIGNVDLSKVRGLETVKHSGPSTIGIDIIYRSQGQIPEVFLSSAGVPETFINFARSLTNQSTDYYTCFISYSSKDQSFVERLFADLRSKGVHCWFAPEDLKTGDKFRSRIDESIRKFDKLLLILSGHSIASSWVAYEVERALDKEPEGIPNVLFPIRLDDAVMKSKAGWVESIRRSRHIGDFTKWKNQDDYQKSFSRLLRDLKAES